MNPIRFRRLLFRGGLILLVAALFLDVRWAGIIQPAQAQASLPAQPTGLSVFHRSGQTFVTWKEVSGIIGERYRIYRHNQPVTSSNLSSAELLLEVAEGSSRFLANRYYNDVAGVWENRHVERFVIDDFGQQLPLDTGLLVWTLGAEDFGGAGSGAGYYAVTTVSFQGVENTQAFSGGNASGPVNESVQDPLPVEINHSMGSGWRVFIQFMDLRNWNPTFNAPSQLNSYYGYSSGTLFATRAPQYAYDYAVYTPNAANCGGSVPATLPVVLALHGYRGNNKFFRWDEVKPWCAYQVFPVDVGNTWWFGFARDYPYWGYTSGATPGPGDTIVNYTEQRLLRQIYDLMRSPGGPAVDTNRIYLRGHSMGGSGVLAMATRYGNVFAAADASKPMTNYRTATTFWVNDVSVKWGAQAYELPVALGAPAGWAAHLQPYQGTSVWDWQNHQANLQNRQADPMVPLGLVHSMTDATITWLPQGQPVYPALNASRQAWGAAIRQDRHDDASLLGLPPNLAVDASGVPFAGLKVVHSESAPGFSNASLNPPLPPSAVGKYNHTLLWSSSALPWDGPPQETASSWQISLCAVDAAAAVKTCGTGVDQTVDVTPRRLQLFHPQPGATYQWENRRVSDNSLVASGSVTAGSSGLITVPAVAVSPQGNRLRIYSGSPPPPSTPTPTVLATLTSTLPPPPTPTTTPPPPTATPLPATHTPLPPSSTPTVLPPDTPTPTLPPAATATYTPLPQPSATSTSPAVPTATNTPSPATATPLPASPTSLPPTPTSGAGSTGWHSPSGEQAGQGGDRNGLELNPASAFVDDGQFAMSLDTGANTRSTCTPGQEDFHRFYNFGFALPSGATITGVELLLDAAVDATAGSPRFCASFSWNGGSSWSEHQTANLTQTAENTYLLGGPNATWGWNWTPAQFNDGSFMLRLVMDASTTDRDFSLDWVAVQVHYR